MICDVRGNQPLELDGYTVPLFIELRSLAHALRSSWIVSIHRLVSPKRPALFEARDNKSIVQEKQEAARSGRSLLPARSPRPRQEVRRLNTTRQRSANRSVFTWLVYVRRFEGNRLVMGDEQGQIRDSNASAEGDSWPYDPYWEEIDRPLEKLRLAAQAEFTAHVSSEPNTPASN
jgi:hypothetical protein